MKVIILCGLIAGLFLFPACSKVKTAGSQAGGLDSVGQSEIPMESSEEIPEEENINDEDHGDPGLGVYLISSEELDSKLLDFMTRFNEDSLKSRISESRPVLIRASDSTLTLGTVWEHLISIDPLRQYLRATMPSTVNWYRAVPPKCIIIENFPDGIYLSETDFQSNPIQEGAEETGIFLEKLNRSKGYELILKFSYENGDQSYLDLVLYEDAGRLELGTVDLGECVQ